MPFFTQASSFYSCKSILSVSFKIDRFESSISIGSKSQEELNYLSPSFDPSHPLRSKEEMVQSFREFIENYFMTQILQDPIKALGYTSSTGSDLSTNTYIFHEFTKNNGILHVEPLPGFENLGRVRIRPGSIANNHSSGRSEYQIYKNDPGVIIDLLNFPVTHKVEVNQTHVSYDFFEWRARFLQMNVRYDAVLPHQLDLQKLAQFLSDGPLKKLPTRNRDYFFNTVGTAPNQMKDLQQRLSYSIANTFRNFLNKSILVKSVELMTTGTGNKFLFIENLNGEISRLSLADNRVLSLFRVAVDSLDYNDRKKAEKLIGLK